MNKPADNPVNLKSLSCVNLTHIMIIIIIIAGAFSVFVFNAQAYKNFISDDALISLRYCDNFLHGHGLAWNDSGRPVEGYSNLLWILLVSFIGLFRVDLITAARIAGHACVLLMMIPLALEFLRMRSKNYFGLAIPLLFIAFSGTVAAWGMGGLEQPLVCALLGFSVWVVFKYMEDGDKSFKAVVLPGTIMGFLVLSRLDGILFVFVITAVLFLMNVKKGGESYKSLKLLYIPLATYIAQAIFRFIYYGTLIPNTALVKLTPSIFHAKSGFEYMAGGLISMKILFLFALAGAVYAFFDRALRKKVIILLALILSWFAYVVFIGGDIFPGYRHMMPAIMIAVFLMLEGFIKAGYAKHKLMINIPLILAGCFFCSFYGITQSWEFQNYKAATEKWEQSAMEAGRILGSMFEKESPLVAVTAAGSLPYASHLPSLDLFGLNDYELPRYYRSSGAGKGWIGHEVGSAKYVIKKMPDFISLYDGSVDTVHYNWWKELIDMPEFKNNYRLIYFYCPENKFTAKLWANTYSGKIGITTEGNHINIPVYFFSSEKNPVLMDENIEPVLNIKSKSRVIAFGMVIPAGHYVFNSENKPKIKLNIIKINETTIRLKAISSDYIIKKKYNMVNLEIYNQSENDMILKTTNLTIK